MASLAPQLDAHFHSLRANFVTCEECNESYFFDFLRHPRYFVAHFKMCHLKNLLYRFNGFSEEENQKVRFGPRRKKDANAWFCQLKSTEKRMISMQDNKWSEITERDCWSCHLCNNGKTDLTHVFEQSEVGRDQAVLHLRQFHEEAYNAFLEALPDVEEAALGSLYPAVDGSRSRSRSTKGPSGGGGGSGSGSGSGSSGSGRTSAQRRAEAERSRLRRQAATAEDRQVEAMRSKRRRAQMTPVQRQADYDRRKRRKKRLEERERSKQRRVDATDEMREREVVRSRERRRNATEEQRQREALRSKRRRENATAEQKCRERDRCRKRYELKKQKKQLEADAQRQEDIHRRQAFHQHQLQVLQREQLEREERPRLDRLPGSESAAMAAVSQEPRQWTNSHREATAEPVAPIPAIPPALAPALAPVPAPASAPALAPACVDGVVRRNWSALSGLSLHSTAAPRPPSSLDGLSIALPTSPRGVLPLGPSDMYGLPPTTGSFAYGLSVGMGMSMGQFGLYGGMPPAPTAQDRRGLGHRDGQGESEGDGSRHHGGPSDVSHHLI